MKALLFILLGISLSSAAETTYTNFVRQVQMPQPGGTIYDLSPVAPTGEQDSPLPIDPGGARFELWTIKSGPVPTSIHLATRYVSTYTPIGFLKITSEDPYLEIPRTRADRPFDVIITTLGLRNGVDDPEASKSVDFLRHVQSYGPGGTGIGLDRTQASLLTHSTISQNVTDQSFHYVLTSIPANDRSKVRGEERFSLYTLADYQAPASQLASASIQIWPIADGTISGITNNDEFRFKLPQLTLTLNDLYPSSTTYAQVYQGSPRLGEEGKVVPGSALVLNETIPQNRVLTLKNYEYLFNANGQWTMELLTSTPFGVDRLHYVTFQINRTIKMNGTLTTIEQE